MWMRSALRTSSSLGNGIVSGVQTRWPVWFLASVAGLSKIFPSDDNVEIVLPKRMKAQIMMLMVAALDHTVWGSA